MLKELILKARKKPKHVRDNIAFGIAGGFTAAICLVWLVVMPGRLAKETTSVNDNHKIFSTFFNQFKDQVASVKNSLPDTHATNTPVVVASTSKENSMTELTASSSGWSLSSSTIKEKSIPKEVPIMIISNGSSSASTSATELNR
jgi:hypothetical protein